jgi:hypothetical protein
MPIATVTATATIAPIQTERSRVKNVPAAQTVAVSAAKALAEARRHVTKATAAATPQSKRPAPFETGSRNGPYARPLVSVAVELTMKWGKTSASRLAASKRAVSPR